MKTLNTLIISSLLALSLNTTVSAADLGQQTTEMNQALQAQIDRKMSQMLQTQETAKSQTMVFHTNDVSAQKVSSNRS